MTEIVALHIPVWMVVLREERLQARQILWPVYAGRVIYMESGKSELYGISNHHRPIWDCVGGICRRFKSNEPYWHWRQDGCWHPLSIVTQATALHISPSVATTTVSRQKSGQSCCNVTWMLIYSPRERHLDIIVISTQLLSSLEKSGSDVREHW